MLEKNPHPWVGNMGVAALIALGGPEARAALQKLAEQGHQWGEKGLQELLLREGPTSELVRQLNDGKNAQRGLIADLLALRGDATAVPALKSVVDREQNPEVLSSGIAALVKLEGAAATPQALAAIERCSYAGQLKIAAALAYIDADEGFEWLVEGLRSDNRFRRYACANALAQSKRSAAEKGLLIALSDQSHWVRQAAIGGLAHCGSRKALDPLGKATRNDSQEYLRIEAAWAIEKILQRDKNGVPGSTVN
jgi:HEAT repeat protein